MRTHTSTVSYHINRVNITLTKYEVDALFFLGIYILVVFGELSLRQSALGCGCREIQKMLGWKEGSEEREKRKEWYGNQI